MAQWSIDPDHAVGEFTVYHMMVTRVHGQMNSVTGSITFDPSDPGSASVEVEIDAAGIYTGVERRDNHLKSADFLDVEKFPKMRFRSTLIEVVCRNTCKVMGDLTIRDRAIPVTFDVGFLGPSRFFDDDLGRTYTTFGFHATSCIKRQDFGLSWNMAIEDGGFMVGDYVEIAFSAEADMEE